MSITTYYRHHLPHFLTICGCSHMGGAVCLLLPPLLLSLHFGQSIAALKDWLGRHIGPQVEGELPLRRGFPPMVLTTGRLPLRSRVRHCTFTTVVRGFLLFPPRDCSQGSHSASLANHVLAVVAVCNVPFQQQIAATVRRRSISGDVRGTDH